MSPFHETFIHICSQHYVDNIDHIEDTLSVRVTSHRGIGIAIQKWFIAGNKTGPPNTIAMEPHNAFALLDAERKTLGFLSATSTWYSKLDRFNIPRNLSINVLA